MLLILLELAEGATSNANCFRLNLQVMRIVSDLIYCFIGS